MRISVFDSTFEEEQFLRELVANASKLDCIIIHALSNPTKFKAKFKADAVLSLLEAKESIKLSPGNCFLVSESYDYQIANNQLIISKKEKNPLEKELLKEQNKFRRIADALDKSALVSITDEKGIITHANPEFCKVSKYKQIELIGQNHRIINSGHHPKSFFSDMWKTITAGKTWRSDVKNKAKDGSYYWVDTVINPIVDETGKIESFLSIRYLITDQKKLKEKFELALKATHYGHWDYDLSNEEIFYSDRWFDILGQTPKPITDKNYWKKFLHPDEKEAKIKTVQNAIEGSKNTYQIEARMKHADGHYVPVLVSGLITNDTKGKPTRVTGTMMDLTEWKKKESEIEALNNDYEELINSLDGIIWESCLESKGFTFVSKQAKSILGYEPDEWMGSPNFWVDTMHPKDREWAPSYCDKNSRALKNHEFEYRMIHKSGREVWIRDLVTVIQDDENNIKLRGIMLDITDKKIAEEALKASERKLQFITENTSDGIAIHDKVKDQITFSTAAYNRILGHTKEDNKALSLENIRSRVHPDDVDYVFAKAYDAINSKRPNVFYEYRIKNKKDNYIWREDSINLIYDSEGNHVKSVIVARDVTERKRIENTLKESEAKHRYLVETSKELICIHEPDGKYKYVSPSSESLLGYKPEELLGKSPYSYFHPDDIKRIENASHKPSLNGLKTQNIQYRFRKKDGNYIWFDSYTEVITNDNKVTSLMTGSRDITDLKNIEFDLSASENKFRGLADNVPGTIYLCENDERYSMHYLNDNVLELTGYSAEEFINDEVSFVELYDPEDHERVVREINEGVDNRQSFHVTYRIRHRSGEWRWVEEYGLGIFKDDELLYLEGILLDVTQSKETERALKKSEAMLADVANSIPGVILRYKILPNGEDEIDFISKGVEQLWEISLEELNYNVNKLWDRIHPEDLPLMLSTIERSAEKLEPWRCDYRIIMPDGRVKWISAIGEPNKLEDGSLLWHTLCLDVTEKKKFEHELEQTLQQFNLGIETAELGVWENDLKSNELSWNNNMFSIFDVKKDLFSGEIKEFRNRVFPEDLDYADKEMNKIFHGEIVRDVRFRIKTDKGEIKHIYASGAPIKNDKGETIKLMGINIDVTRVAEYQESLEKTINEKETLFRELHHRIKNNLQIVSSILFVKSEYSKNKSLQDFINETSLRINSISKIHEQLLQLEGIDELDIKLYLEGLTQEIVRTFNSTHNNYYLEQDIESQILNVDTALNIGLIVNEILSNCIKYAYPNSESGPIFLALKKNKTHLHLSIKDEGIGIPKEILNNISNSYGLSLIELFTSQIKGELSIKNGTGTGYEIKIPVT